MSWREWLMLYHFLLVYTVTFPRQKRKVVLVHKPGYWSNGLCHWDAHMLLANCFVEQRSKLHMSNGKPQWAMGIFMGGASFFCSFLGPSLLG